MPENQNVIKNDENNSINITAKTIEEAIETGLAELGLSQEQVDIEIINEGKRGVFGLGSEESVVMLTPIADVTEATPPEEQSVDSLDEDEPASVETLAADLDPESVEAVSAQYLSGLLERMGINAQVVIGDGAELVEPNEEVPLVLDVKGKDLGVLIGRRSETLQVLQYMVRLMVSKHFNKWEPVIIDVESYRVRRRRSLNKMALKMAERAESTDRPVVLEAMPAHERRLIHLALRDHPTVVTKSVGSDENRKVTILPK